MRRGRRRQAARMHVYTDGKRLIAITPALDATAPPEPSRGARPGPLLLTRVAPTEPVRLRRYEIASADLRLDDPGDDPRAIEARVCALIRGRPDLEWREIDG